MDLVLIGVACVVVVGLAALVFGAVTRRRKAEKTSRSPEDAGAAMYAGLRQQALTTRPETFGVRAAEDGGPTVYGVVMETGYPQGTATLVGFSTGDASLYFSRGGGIIGGGGHPTVRTAATDQIALAQLHLGGLQQTSEFPIPAEGRTRFYVLTTEGVHTAEAAEQELGDTEHPLSSLFHAGHRLIYELRTVTPETAAA